MTGKMARLYFQEGHYLFADKELGIDIGKKVTFRHKDTKHGNIIVPHIDGS